MGVMTPSTGGHTKVTSPVALCGWTETSSILASTSYANR
jgi:hypothetical protein